MGFLSQRTPHWREAYSKQERMRQIALKITEAERDRVYHELRPTMTEDEAIAEIRKIKASTLSPEVWERHYADVAERVDRFIWAKYGCWL